MSRSKEPIQTDTYTRRPDLPDDRYYARRELKRAGDERMMRVREPSRKPILYTIFSWAFQIVLVIMFAYVLVYFFGQRRTNVGQSMNTTLSGGDVVLINVLAYQIGDPARGDLICFKPNGNESSHSLIRRVIGLPGETIRIVDGMIVIDGKTYLEQADYPTMTNPGIAAEEITLGDSEFFVLGDNRNNSEDSRSADIGIVTSDMIEGRAWMIISPAGHRGLIS